MAFNLGQRIRVSSKHADIDERKGPFNSITEALIANSPASREKGRTVYIIENGKVVEYWFEAGTADSDLVKKTQGGSGDLTPIFKTATMTDIGASESETQDDIDQKFATWIESQGFVIPQGEIWFFELLREGSKDGDGGSSNITLEQARQNGNVLGGNIIGEEEFDKQGNRKAFAQMSDVYDNAGIPLTGQFTQTQNIGDVAEFQTNGQPFLIKQLPDKTLDGTFTDIIGKDNQGQIAKVGYPALDNLFSGLTSGQALSLAQKLNGGVGSSGMMSVNIISPPLFEKEDNNIYVVLRGANLNLNIQAMSIEIVRASDNTVMATVPNSQIQLYADGLSLVFYYNFNALPEDMYKLKITSGVKVLITALSFQIVGSVENIDTSAIVWNKLIDTNVITNDQSTGNGGNISISDNQNAVDTTSPVISMLSSQLFAQGEDWYIELQVSTGNKRPQYKNLMTRIGVCYSNISNQLVFLPIHFWEYGKYDPILLITHINTVQGNIQFEGEGDKVTTKILSITKIGNTLTITDGKQVGIMTISNNSGYALSVQTSASISVYPNTPPYNNEVCTVTILKAFKIN